MVKVLLYGELAEMAGTPEVSVAGSRVLDVLTALASLYGSEFRNLVLSAGRVAVLVNGTPVRYGPLETRLTDGDVLSLMPLPDFED